MEQEQIDIYELKPGRELDALIAIKVLSINEFLVHTEEQSKLIDVPILGQSLVQPVSRYSTDMRVAWDVVATVSEKTRWYEMAWRSTGATANFTGNTHDTAYANFEETGNNRSAAQALAICRAALKAQASGWLDDDVEELPEERRSADAIDQQLKRAKEREAIMEQLLHTSTQILNKLQERRENKTEE